MDVIFLDPPTVPGEPLCAPCVLALGFFDGVHLAHRALLERAALLAEREGAELAVLTFDPHPRQVLSGLAEPMEVLTPLPVKARLFARLGVDRMIVIRFTEAVAKMCPEAFVRDYIGRLHVLHVVTGFDFRFGARGAGSAQTLREEAGGAFGVHVVGEIRLGGRKIGSTLIRGLIREGKMEEVPDYLGAFYEMSGRLQPDGAFRQAGSFVVPKPGAYRAEIEASGAASAVPTFCLVDSSGSIRIPHAPGIATGGADIRIRWLQRLDAANSRLRNAVDESSIADAIDERSIVKCY